MHWTSSLHYCAVHVHTRARARNPSRPLLHCRHQRSSRAHKQLGQRTPLGGALGRTNRAHLGGTQVGRATDQPNWTRRARSPGQIQGPATNDRPPGHLHHITGRRRAAMHVAVAAGKSQYSRPIAASRCGAGTDRVGGRRSVGRRLRRAVHARPPCMYTQQYNSCCRRAVWFQWEERKEEWENRWRVPEERDTPMNDERMDGHSSSSRSKRSAKHESL